MLKCDKHDVIYINCFVWHVSCQASYSSLVCPRLHTRCSQPTSFTMKEENASPEKDHCEFDDILKHWLGEFGRYQKILYVVACLWCIPICFPIYTMVFASAVPSFQCVSPDSITNSTTVCAVKRCCSNCTKYEFTGPFTSVVSEVR